MSNGSWIILLNAKWAMADRSGSANTYLTATARSNDDALAYSMICTPATELGMALPSPDE